MTSLWDRVDSVLNEVLGSIKKGSISNLGNITKVVLKEDNYLLKILFTAGKKAITRKWLEMDPP